MASLRTPGVCAWVGANYLDRRFSRLILNATTLVAFVERLHDVDGLGPAWHFEHLVLGDTEDSVVVEQQAHRVGWHVLGIGGVAVDVSEMSAVIAPIRRTTVDS